MPTDTAVGAHSTMTMSPTATVVFTASLCFPWNFYYYIIVAVFIEILLNFLVASPVIQTFFETFV